MTVSVNTSVSGGGGGGGGSSTYAGLTDATTVDLGVVNTPLAGELAAKADLLSSVVLGAGTTAITHSGYANRPVSTNQSGSTIGTFSGTGTSGAVDGDGVEILNTGLGVFTATGTITASEGYKLFADPGETFTAIYDATADAWFSTTPNLSAAEGMAESAFGFFVSPSTGSSAILNVGINAPSILDTSAVGSGSATSDLGGYRPRTRITAAAAAINRVAGYASSTNTGLSGMRLDVGGTYNGGFPIVIEAAASDSAQSLSTSTVTITSANPGVVSWTAHGLAAGQMVKFSTTGALPTNLVAGTIYFVAFGASYLTNSFDVSTSFANAVAGTLIDCTAGTQSGVQTCTAISGSFFMGVTGTSASPNFTATEPSAWGANDILGVGWDSIGANGATMNIYQNDNAGAVVVTNLGANFPKVQGQLYRVVIDKNAAGTSIYLRVAKIVVGGTNVYSDRYTLTTDIPRATIPLYACFARSSMAGAYAASIDFAYMSRGRPL